VLMAVDEAAVVVVVEDVKVAVEEVLNCAE